MNRLVFFLALIFMSACQGQKADNKTTIGENVPTENAVSIATLPDMLQDMNSKDDVVLTGEVTEVCKAKGCWMKLKMSDNQDVRVTFKDYALFMPKDIVGKEVVIHGVASKKEISVDELQHYAKDAGKSEEEIAMIAQPEVRLTFEADGVVIN